MSKVLENSRPEEYGFLTTQKELKIQKIENKRIDIDFEFWKEIASKKYLKFSKENIEKILNWNISIPLRIFNEIKESKLVFLFYSILLKFRNKKYLSKLFFKDFGFCKTSIKYAINFLVKKELIIVSKSGIKIAKNFYPKQGEQFIKIKEKLDWKLILLLSPKYLLAFKRILWKSKLIPNKKHNNESTAKVLMQNAFLGLKKWTSRILISFLLKQFNIYGIKNLFSYKRKYDKQRKMFVTERFLLKRLTYGQIFMGV